MRNKSRDRSRVRANQVGGASGLAVWLPAAGNMGGSSRLRGAGSAWAGSTGNMGKWCRVLGRAEGG